MSHTILRPFIVKVSVLGYFPLVELRSSPSSNIYYIIRELKRIFSRHWIPEVIRSDNGPQYASLEFIKFTREYEIRHIISLGSRNNR